MFTTALHDEDFPGIAFHSLPQVSTQVNPVSTSATVYGTFNCRAAIATAAATENNRIKIVSACTVNHSSIRFMSFPSRYRIDRLRKTENLPSASGANAQPCCLRLSPYAPFNHSRASATASCSKYRIFALVNGLQIVAMTCCHHFSPTIASFSMSAK